MFPPRKGDLARAELMALAGKTRQEYAARGAETDIFFKFTCEHCGERCTLDQPNTLFESGECYACGGSTPIAFGGFLTATKVPHQEEKE